jgi:hypothetical protein
VSQRVDDVADLRLDHHDLRGVPQRGVGAQQQWNERLQGRLEGTVWNAGNCKSWYLDEHGRNPSIWPTYTWRFRRATRRFDLGEYQLATTVNAGRPALDHA